MNTTPMRVPEHFSRVDIGAYMRELRQHYGLSEQDVSERLHIRLKYIAAIEAAHFEAMPGRAYARGYVHTYAEFLGLDADHLVERCFGGEMAREVQAHSIPDSASWYKRNRHYGGIVTVLLLLGVLGYFAFAGRPGAENGGIRRVAAVESVPEEYLAGMRTRLMPTARTHACLGEPTPLGCYYAQQLTRQWVRPAAAPSMAPAPATAYGETQTPAEDDDDAGSGREASATETSPPSPAAEKNTAKSTAKTSPPPAVKPTPPVNEKYPGMPADYKGYYVPPKPKSKPKPEPAPRPATEEAPAVSTAAPEEDVSEDTGDDE